MKSLSSFPLGPVSLRHIGVGALIFSATLARADTLAQYSFTGGSLVATSFDSVNFVSAGNVSRGATFNSPASFSTDWVYAQGSQTPGSDPGSSSTAYFTFTLTPKAGVTYSLTSLTFDVAFYESSGASNTSYTTNYSVRSDVLGYGTNIDSFSEAGQTSATPTFHGKTISLSASDYQSIGGSSITFRIYMWDAISGGSRLSAIDNIALNGTVAAVPESSACAGLLGFAAILFAGIRRRQAAQR